MIVYAWNSQGAKYNNFKHFLTPNTNFALAISEAGWAPWVPRDNVKVIANKEYKYGDNNTNLAFGQGSNLYSDLWNFLEGGRTGASKSGASWWPWVADYSNETNTRCSSALISNLPYKATNTAAGQGSQDGIRNISVSDFNFAGKNGPRTVRVVSCHLRASGNAQDDLAEVAKFVAAQTGANTTTIVVGDMNINLNKDSEKQTAVTALTNKLGAKNFGILSQANPTHKNGGNLDWGFWYDPNNVGHGWTMQKRAGYSGDNTPENGISSAEWTWSNSDHAVLQYALDETKL